MENTYYLGIDVSKNRLDCCLKTGQQFFYSSFKNQEHGFERLLNWLLKHNGDLTLFFSCCEATGIYSQSVVQYLYEAGVKISVENPLKIKRFIEQHLIAVKTDKHDAKMIACYCELHKPKPYQPSTQAENDLRALTRQLNYYTEMRTAQLNKLKSSPEIAAQYIRQTLVHIENQIADIEREIGQLINGNSKLNEQSQRLKQIGGIGSKTVPVILSVLSERHYPNAKHFVSYLGLNPIIRQSGKSKTYYVRISKQGDKYARRSLYMPALVCLRLPEWQPFVTRLKSKGKTGKQIIVAIMRKLAVYCYTVISTNEPFNPAKLSGNTQSGKTVKGEGL